MATDDISLAYLCKTIAYVSIRTNLQITIRLSVCQWISLKFPIYMNNFRNHFQDVLLHSQLGTTRPLYFTSLKLSLSFIQNSCLFRRTPNRHQQGIEPRSWPWDWSWIPLFPWAEPYSYIFKGYVVELSLTIKHKNTIRIFCDHAI